MQKDVADAIMALALSFDDIILRLYENVRKIDDENIRNSFDLAVGNVMGCITKEIIFPIERMYPDLKPKD